MKPALETHKSIFDVYHGKKDTSLRLATVALVAADAHERLASAFNVAAVQLTACEITLRMRHENKGNHEDTKARRRSCVLGFLRVFATSWLHFVDL